MEIEAKFQVDRDALQRLAGRRHLGTWQLEEATTTTVRDTYFDTDDRITWHRGYALRMRRKGDSTSVTLTLKGLGEAGGGVHRREELETTLIDELPFPEWPDSTVRRRVEEMIGDQQLAVLLQIEQVRHSRIATFNGRAAAELSLDEVTAGSTGNRQQWHVVEVELLPAGTERDLADITEALQAVEDLIPDDRSKLHAAQELCGLRPAELLTGVQRRVLTALSQRSDLHGRRARALLALDDGATQAEAAGQAQMSERRVRHWLAELRKRGLSIFRDQVLRSVEGAGGIDAEPPAPASAKQKGPERVASSSSSVQIETSAAASFGERLATVTSALLSLLDDLMVLDKADQRQLDVCTRFVARGVELDPKRPHVAARKAVLHDPPKGVAPTAVIQAALTAHLTRGRITTGRVDRVLARDFVAQLSHEATQRALLLAALLRPALAITLRLPERLTIQRTDRATAVQLLVLGSDSTAVALDAQRSCDLWHLIAPSRLRFASKRGPNRLQPLACLLSLPDGTPHPDDLNLPPVPGLDLDDLVVEAAWKTFLFHFEQMLMHEPGTRAGIDPEELHDMRVATRRMRVAAQVLGDHLDADMLRPHVRGMRRTGRGLGPVRDLDVFWESVETSQSALRDSHDLEPLRAAWGRAHARAREGMLAYLDGAQYRRFVERFGEQLHRPWLPAHPAISSKGEALVRRIRHVAPALVLDRLADVLAYEEWVLDPHREVPLRRYHRLRIAIKQLRYTLEYLRELLGNDVRPVIKTVKQVQSHLGDLQDAVVGCAFIRDFLMWGELDPDPVALPEPPVQPVVAPDVAELFVHWQRQIGNRVQTFPDVWRQRITPDLQLKIAHLATDMAARAP